MLPFKIWCEKREMKKCIIADSLKNLEEQVQERFLFSQFDSVKFVLEEDGTAIEDDASLVAFKTNVIMALSENAVWTASARKSSPDDLNSSASGSASPRSNEASSVTSSPSSSLTPSSSRTPTSSRQRSRNFYAAAVPRPLNWGSTFQVPWSKLPTQLLTRLENSRNRETESAMKLKNTEINDIVRAVVPEIRLTSINAGRDVFGAVAETMVEKYLVLADLDEEGKKIGSGLGTLAVKMEEHNNYLNRPSKNATLLAFISSPVGADGKRKRKKDKKSEQSGTADWQPEYPELEDEKTQTEKKKWLISEARKSEKDRDTEKVLNYMEVTYASQRLLLNSGNATVLELKTNWPFLLETTHLFNHCERLILEFHSDVNYWSPEKLKKIIFFMEESVTVEKAKAILEKNEELKARKIKAADDGCRIVQAAKDSQVVGAVQLIMHRFNEKKGCNLLLVHLEEGATRDEVLAAPRTPSPCIVVVGRNVYEGTTHYVVAENAIISAHSQATEALTVAYCLMYLFNMKYPDRIGYTWEFIQRYIFKNDPTEGSKNPKRRAAFINISPPVNSFVRDLVRFKVVEPAGEDELDN